LNAVEIEEAVSLLAEQPFSPENFPYAFLEAFGNKETTIKRLRAGASNKSDLGGVLQTNNIHIATCNPGDVTRTLTALRESPATIKAKAKFVLATDGVDFEAEELTNGETVACAFKDFPDHFGFFLALAGISTVRQIAENSFDIRATSRLNRLYVELRKDNPDWETGDRRHDMNHFMARLIFCFFAEDTYTYYEQLNGYEYLKQLDIGYYFYSGSYADEILSVLDPAKKTIVHIPNVNARESTKDKIKEVEHIIGALGEWQGIDPATGFQLVKIPSGKILRIADLVDDDPARRDRVVSALKDPAQKFNRDHVDIIIALGMAKEGFDWIWCEHALTVGYRSSLTEIVQIIGRVTRDAEGKTTAQFTNLIAEPDAAEEAVSEAVNDTLKAIAASLLMEQVLAPRFEFRPKNSANQATPGYEYGAGGYDENRCNVGVNGQTGAIQIEIKGLTLPKTKEATRICQEDLNEVIAAFVQDKTAIERGLFDEELVPEELTQLRMGNIVRDKYPALDAEDQEAVRQHAIAALNFTQQAKKVSGGGGDDEPKANMGLIEGVRRFAMDVRELDIDLIDRINPFGEAYAILAKTMSEESLRHVAAAITAKRTALTPEEALDLAKRASRFKKEHNRFPSLTAQDPWERKMAEGAAAFVRFKDEGRYV
jgi:hypothetical protein